MLDRAINWVTVEPAISLLMIITAVVIFGSAFRKSQDASTTFWPWLRRIIEASVGAVLFLGLLWAFRAILNNNNVTFNSTHGSWLDSSPWRIPFRVSSNRRANAIRSTTSCKWA
jgi:hypothetical protein